MSHMFFMNRSMNQASPSVVQYGGGNNDATAVRAAENDLLSINDPEPTIEVLPVSKRSLRRFSTEATDYKVNINMPDSMPHDLLKYFEKAFKKITSDVLDGIPENDMVGLIFSWDSLDHRAYYPFGLKKDFSASKFLEKLDKILQSNDTLSLDHPITVTVTTVEMPQGEGKRDTRGMATRSEPDLIKWLKKKQCIICIDNDDSLCLGRALAVAIGRLDWKEGKMTDGEFKYLCMSKKSKQKLKAIELYEKAGVPLGPCGIPEVVKFQTSLDGYQITVRSANTAGGIIYEGPEAPKEIELFLYNNHFYVITSIPALIGRSYYCKLCKKGYSNNNLHKCTNACKCCRKANCLVGEWKKCDECNRYMKSQECFDNHKKKGKSYVTVDPETKKSIHHPPMAVCDKFKLCVNCNLPKKYGKKHYCGELTCNTCKRFRPIDHLCYIPTIEEKEEIDHTLAPKKKKMIFRRKKKTTRRMDANNLEDQLQRDEAEEAEQMARELGVYADDDDDDDSANSGNESDFDEATEDVVKLDDVYHFIWYDMETTQDTPIEGKDGWFMHRVNLVIAQTSCNSCSVNFTQNPDCPDCVKRVFSGDDSIKDFVTWLLTCDGGIAVAHNSSGFDGILLVKEVTSRGLIIKNAVLRGQKLLCCKIPTGLYGVRLIDSMNFVMGPLSLFPKVFDLQELKKGYFPHYFNTSDNASYSGPMPDISHYDPDGMKPAARLEFLEWYEKHKGDHFNMQKEIVDYCESDVDILCQSMMKFRGIFFNLTKVDCLRSCSTIASSAMRTFQQNYLKEDHLGVIPRKGYTNYSRQSKIGMVWLKWWSHTHDNAVLEHNSNGKEHRIGNYLVDGYHVSSHTVLEFLGCHFHSCPKCTDHTRINPTTTKLRKGEYEHTLKRLAFIESEGYKVNVIWECDFKKEMEENSNLKAFVEAQHVTTPLKPVDTLFGGRTNAMRLHYDCEDEEEIKVLDFTSLYPFCNSRCSYPIHHPVIITEHFKDISEYYGFIKCRVLPPNNLHIPVLPFRCNGKLTFPLCALCAKDTDYCCSHSNDERSWIGTFVSLELQKAVEMGYVVVHIYEVWHWEEKSQYDPETKEGGLFTEYTKTFLKIKQESSGWPSGCLTEADKRNYLTTYIEHEGITLDPTKIKKTPLRAIAKLLLNSLWGKFAQNSDLTKTEYVQSYPQLVKILLDDTLEVSNLFLLNEDVGMIQYKSKEPTALCTENVAVASFTTAHARLRLYGVMQEIAKGDCNRLLYTDTDSVFYVKRTDLPDPACGEFLGDLTDEYPDKKIVQFCSGGPKNYMYKFADGTHVTKVKGFTLNVRNSEVITPDLMNDLVKCNDGRKVVVSNKRKITRSREYGIVSKPEDRSYRVVYTKRILMEDGTTLPFGWVSQSAHEPATKRARLT